MRIERPIYADTSDYLKKEFGIGEGNNRKSN